MNPLPPLALLATHIDHKHLMVPEIKARFCDADRASSTVNDVLLVWSIVGFKEPVQIREIIVQAVQGVDERSEKSR